MTNIFYLVIFVLGANGVTSESIPQANLKQCEINAKVFNTGNNKRIVYNGAGANSSRTQSAYCIAGIK